MGKRVTAKRPAPDNDDDHRADAQERRFKWWQLIIASVLVPLFVALLQYVPPIRDLLISDPPQFALANPITRPDSGITILPQNRAAARQRPLNVEFDGLLFANGGRVHSNGKELFWHFKLINLSLPDSLLRDGVHHVRLGFAGDALSEPLLLIFHTKPPVVEAEVLQPPGKPADRVFIGRVASTLQVPAETLSVDLLFQSEGQPMQISLPVRRVTEESIGLTYFEFETTIQGLPKISPRDPRYAEPFFAIRVTDQAGNRYYQQESYAQFMAPGDKRFGVNSLADIEMKRLAPDLRQKTTVAFRLVPRPAPMTQLANGQTAINLQVSSVTGQIKQLEWTSIPESLRARQQITTILRDEQPLAISFANEYQDEQAPANRDPSYRVEQAGRDGKIYSSNATKPSASILETAVEKPATPQRQALADTVKSRDENEIEQVVARHRAELQFCYENARRQNPALAGGKIVVRFIITPQGQVRDAWLVSSTINNAEIEQCILARIKRWSDFTPIHPQSANMLAERIFLFGN
jgi:hypothetical protein